VNGSLQAYYGDYQFFTVTGTDSQNTVTTLPINVDNPPSTATLSGFVTYSSGSQIEVFYELLRDCNLTDTPIVTQVETLTATGLPQRAGDATVFNLTPGLYCYRVVSRLVATPKPGTRALAKFIAVLFGQYENFMVTGNYTQATTLPALITPGPNASCVVFRGTSYITPGVSVAYNFGYGTSLDARTYVFVSSTTTHSSAGNETAQPIQVCGLIPGQYYYQLQVVINPGTASESAVYGGVQPFAVYARVGNGPVLPVAKVLWLG